MRRMIVLLSVLIAAKSLAIELVDLKNTENRLLHLILNPQSQAFQYNADKPFVLKSGKLSPIFINFGKLSDGNSIAELGNIYADAILDSKLEFDILFGSAYKGIPLAVTVARSLYERHNLNIPYAYNRKEVKDHGEGGQLVGTKLNGKKVLIIDDVITSGKATRQSIAKIKAASGIPTGIVIAIDRRANKTANFMQLPVVRVTTLDTLLAVKENYRHHPQLIVALDMTNITELDSLLPNLDPKLCKLKVGLQLFTAAGPQIIEQLTKRGFDVFLDLKYHDIPNTVYNAVWQAAKMKIWMLTVHASGSEQMLTSARAALNDYASMHPKQKLPLLVGVTVLTSIAENNLQKTYGFANVQTAVLDFAKKAKFAGLDGVVCAVKEARLIKQHLGSDFIVVTPGIRLTTEHQDQKRVASPSEASLAGSDYIVVGRAITRAKNPMEMIGLLTARNSKPEV